MKCSSCKQELNFPEEVLAKFTSCPFCGAALQKDDSEIKKSVTIEDELAKIVSDFGGLEIFAEENYTRLTKALMGVDAAFEPFKDWLLIANLKHIPQKLYAVVEAPQSRKQEIVNECLNTLVSLIFDAKTCKKIILCWMGVLKIDAIVEKKTVIEPIMGVYKYSYEERCGLFDSKSKVYEYKTCQIGDKIWFAENFKHECTDGTGIRSEGIEAENKKYGRLYRGYEAGCAQPPDGWRLPMIEDFADLVAHIKSLGYNAGTALKSTNQWHGEAESGLDLFGLCAYPTARNSETGKSEAWFWTSSKTGNKDYPYYCVCISADSNDVDLQRKANGEHYASIRYVKDVD